MTHKRVRFDKRINELTEALLPHVDFDSVEQAQEVADRHKFRVDHPVTMRVQAMAESLYEQEAGTIEALMQWGADTELGTKYSAVRVAICLCAKRFVAEYELDELADIASSGRLVTA